MTKKELSQLFYLNKEIKIQKEQLEKLENLLQHAQQGRTDSVTGSSASFPYCKHSIKLEGLDAAGLDVCLKYRSEIEEIKNLIELNQKKIVFEFSRLNRYIQDVHDSMMRQILTLRYINGLSWQQIAFATGETDEQYPRRRHNEFLKNNKVDEKDELNVLK